MTWSTVAKKDFRDAVQSRALWALVSVFVVLSLTASYAYVEVPEMFGEPGGATFGGLLFFTVGLTGLFVPITAIVVCYKSIAGERELGSIKLLLSLPTTRSNVYLGKVIGRAAVLAFGLGVGLTAGLGFGSVLLGDIDALSVLVFVFVTVAFAAIYAGSWSRSRRRRDPPRGRRRSHSASSSSSSCSGTSFRWPSSTSSKAFSCQTRSPTGCF